MFRTGLLIAVFGAVPLPLGAGTAEPTEDRTVELPWTSNFAVRAWVDQDGLSLRQTFTLGRSAVIWIEAENASAVAYRAGGGVQADPAAGAGRYAQSPERIEVFFDVVKPGPYWTWYRLRVPAEAPAVKHLEGVDASWGASVNWVTTEGTVGQWRWVRREQPWDFKAGLHELQMDQWTPGVAVDRVALAADPTWRPPDGPGEPASPGEPWATGGSTTDDALFPAVVRWQRVAFAHQETNGGTVGLSFSTDRGQRWSPVPADGRLTDIPTRADGQDRIRFQVRLKRAPDGRSPVVGPLRLTYTGRRDDLWTIEDETARFSFAQGTGALCGIVNKKTGTPLTPLRRPQPLFTVRLRPLAPTPEKDWPVVTSLEARPVAPGRPDPAQPRAWQFRYEIARDDGAAEVGLRAEMTGPGELTWTAEVVNRLSRHEIVDLTYPIVDGLKVNPNPADDTLLINGCYLVKYPATFGRFLYFWPGVFAPILDVSSATEGLSVVAHDPTRRSTGLSCRGLQRRAVELSLVKVVRVRPGASFAGQPHLVRVHTGDWHAAALAERPWLAAAFPTVESPLWLQECDGWNPGGWPIGWWSNLGLLARRTLAQTGMPYMQFWNFQVPGTTWTLPHPNPVNGTEEDLRWGIDQVHRAGARVTFYIQGLLWDPHGEGRSADDAIGHLRRRHLWPGYELPPPGFAQQHAARDADGQVRDWSATEREMCYAASGFQEFKRRWAVDLFMGRLGLDGIYWDSLAHGRTCWASDHGHGDDPGAWGLGAYENHRLIRAAGQRLDPGAVFSLEGADVSLGTVTDIHLDNVPNPEVVRFLCPRLLLYLGSADGADPRRRRAFLHGCRFDGIAPEADQLALLRIRRAVRQYLYPATPMDTMGVEVEGPASIQARLFLCDPGRTRGAVVTILNEDKHPNAWIAVDTSAFGPVKTVWVADADGNEGPLAPGQWRVDGSRCRVPVPRSWATGVLLLAQAEPRVSLQHATLLPRGGRLPVNVTLESLTGESLAGRVRLITPEGLSSSPAAFEGAGPGRPATVALMLEAGEEARLGLTDVPVEIDVRGGPRFGKVATVYVDQPVRVVPEWVGPEKLRLSVENGSSRARSGHVRLEMAGGEVRFQGTPSWDYDLKPGQRQAFAVGLAGAFKCDGPWAVRGEVTCGSSRWPLYAPFRPPILNGSFERYFFRSDIPDYWWGTYVDRTPKIWGTGEFGIDNTVAADGSHSLRLQGDAKQGRAVHLDTVLAPRTRYRFHVQIRRTAHSPNIYAAIWEGRRASGGPEGKADAVSHVAGRVTDGPLNTWQTFETTFTSLPEAEAAGVRLYLYNMNSPATAWFDDIRLVPEEAEESDAVPR